MSKSKLYPFFLTLRKKQKKALAVLIDPDKCTNKHLHHLLSVCKKSKVDVLLVGGSVIQPNKMKTVVAFLKKNTKLPIVLFPGNPSHIDENANAILLLSLLSGRNAEYLIGHHVQAAMRLKKSKLEIIPTAYLLIGDNNTSAAYVSGSPVIPFSKNDIAAATALAGEQLGMQLVYLDAGSGAKDVVSSSMIAAVRKIIGLPLIVGGGINTAQQVNNAYDAGADVVVIGTMLEKNADALLKLRK